MILFPPVLAAPEQTPQQHQAFRAMYDWGFASPSGEGKGTLAVLADLSNGSVIIELHALGERLMLLDGNKNSGYRVQIPRDGVDERAPSLNGLPMPFLPTLNDVNGLVRLLTEGTGSGVKASRKDANGPRQLRWDGKDNQGQSCTVWLKRTRFETVK